MIDLAGLAHAEQAFAHHEHVELMAGLADMHSAADMAGHAQPADVLARLRRVRTWMASVVTPHNAWEESVIFPEIEETCGSMWPTKLMRFDHSQISRASLDLDADIEILVKHVPLHEQRFEMQAHLLNLEALLRALVEREESIVLPLLEGQARHA